MPTVGYEPARILVDVLCGATAVALGVTGAVASQKVRRPRAHGAAKIDGATILACGLALWPPLFDLTAGFATLGRRPALWLAFVWPLAVILFDLVVGTQETAYGQVLHPLQTPMHGTPENSSILAVAFAIGTILTTIKQDPATRDTALALLMAGVTMTIAFVVPVPTVSPDSDLGRNVRMTQKGVFFNYAVGLMLASILVAFKLRAPPALAGSPTAAEILN
jgi:hypothetical protein